MRKVIETSGGELNSLPGKGLWVSINDEQREKLNKVINENKDKSYYFSYRKSYILGILFHSNSNYTIQIFADDLGVGKNVIIRDLEVIEKWLKYFDLSLNKTRNKGISVAGGEFDKRQAIIYNNTSRMDEVIINDDKPDDIDYRVSQQFYSYFTQFYPQYDMFEPQEYLREVEEELGIVFDDVSFTQLLEYIAVSFDRISSGNLIMEPNVLNKCKISNEQFEVASDLIKTMIKNKKVYITLEARAMAAQFAIYGCFADETSFIKEAYYNDLAKSFVEKLQRIIINKKLLINDKLISDLAIFFYKKKMQKTYQVFSAPFMKHDIKQQMPSLYGIVMTNIQPLEDKLKVKFTENDIAYFVILLDNAIEGSNDELQILLYTSFDENTGKYLEKKLKKSIEGVRSIKAIRHENLKKTNTSEYDLVFTTAPCPIEGAIKISRRIDDYDIKIVQQKVDIKLKEKQEIIVNDYQMFYEKMILVHLNAKHKEEVIHKGFELLKEQGFVEDGFEQNMMQRENITPTSIGNEVAIPHVYKSFVKQSAVAVITLERPIEWSNEDKAQVIFLIAIDFETQQEIYSFFSQFYELIDDEQRIEELKNAESSSKILKVIRSTGLK